MPPRKLIKNTKADESTVNAGKLASSRMKGKHDVKEVQEPVEPEVDVMVLVEEMLKESSEKIAAALQQRQENLIQTLANVDAGSTAKTPKK